MARVLRLAQWIALCVAGIRMYLLERLARSEVPARQTGARGFVPRAIHDPNDSLTAQRM